jgi:NADH-quinone oxidoreductase subunit K
MGRMFDVRCEQMNVSSPLPNPERDRAANIEHRTSNMETTLNWYLSLSAVLFSLGVLGVLVRRNAIVILMSVELMLNAVNLTLVAISQSLGDVAGQVLVFFVMSVAAAEAAIGLALVIALFRRKVSVDVTEINLFKY